MSYWTITVRSPYVEKSDRGLRTFDLEALTYEEAVSFAEQHIVAGRESIINIEESTRDWSDDFKYDPDEVITKGKRKSKAISELK